MTRRADLTPPLGWPGGPCHLINRIVEEVKDPRLEQKLVQEVERGVDISNPDASRVYRLDTEVGGGGPFKQLLIGAHAQYRMDLRGVTVPQVRAAIKAWFRVFLDAKSRNDWDYRKWVETLSKGEAVNWTDNRLGLTVVFSTKGPGQIMLVTAYWPGEQDPVTHPGQCTVRAGYRPPSGDLSGWKTVLDRTDNSAPARDVKDQALPSPPWGRSKPTGPQQYNKPPSSEDALDGKPLHKDRTRTLAKPGEDSPPADAELQVTPTRRQDMHAAIDGPTFPGSHRQHKEYGQAKRYFHRYYQQNRNKVHQRMRRWYKKIKRNPKYKRDKARREEYPNRFKRFPGGASTTKERAQEWREKNKSKAKTATWDTGGLPIWFLPDQIPALLVSIDVDLEQATLVLEEDPNATLTLDLEEMFEDIAFDSEEDLERVFQFLDEQMGYVPGTEDAPEDEDTLLDDWYFGPDSKSANFYMEKTDPDVPADQILNRGRDWEPEEKSPLPGFEPGQRPVMDNPGSAKVMPWNSDLVNNKAAVRISEIREKCHDKLLSQAGSLVPVLKRVDAGNLMWLFDVPSSKGAPYRVKLKATARGNVANVGKMDVSVSCSCPYWQWQGPEHHAKVDGYLYGKPVGTAASPTVKDPDGTHRACKHVLAVFNKIESVSVARKKLGSDMAAVRVARRYLEAVLFGRS